MSRAYEFETEEDFVAGWKILAEKFPIETVNETDRYVIVAADLDVHEAIKIGDELFADIPYTTWG